MIKTKKQLVLLVSFILIQVSYGQLEDYSYKRQLNDVSQEWHQVVLPNGIFEKVKVNLGDIRIYKNDSIAIPYLLTISHDKISKNKILFQALNKVQDATYSYITYKVGKDEPINQIKLHFDKKNYDFKVLLQGSENQKKWYDIKTARVLSIANDAINYSYNSLDFNTTNYTYYRIRIPSKKVKLTEAYLYKNTEIKGKENAYQVTKTIEKVDKNTIITVKLNHKVPITKIALEVSSDFDYYRPIHISYVSDSVQTPKGWIYNYETLYRGTLSSLEEKEFQFSSRLAKQLKITINNQDNEPLTFGKLTVLGKEHRLLAHFKATANDNNHYVLAYGNKKVSKPHYDLAYFTSKIPKTLKPVLLGEETRIKTESSQPKNSFLSSEKLLWALLVVLVLFIGKFTLKMLQKPTDFDAVK